MKRLSLKSKFDKIIDDVHDEYCRACKIHPKWPSNVVEALAIIAEESGEAIKAGNEYHHDEGGTFEEIEKEIIQTMSTCMRFLINKEKHKKQVGLIN